MIRRDYHASNYSPLNQITKDNVKDLRLQWVWAMNEGGANQPAPLVHNGIVYLNNPGNVMQAIDGRTGDLIWENRYGTNATGAAMRGIAIYDDKVFTATSERAAGRARCEDRQDRLADHHRRSLEGQLQHEQRPAPRQGQADSGALADARPTAKRNASSARTTPPPAKSCGGSTRSPSKASSAETPGAR